MTDAFLLLIRWAHTLAAVTWVGGGIFYWVVLRPALRVDGVPASARRFIGTEFSQLVTLCMWALVITGGILAFSRLTEQAADTAYATVLAVKVALGAWMFFLAIGRGRRAAEQADGRASKVRAVVNSLGHINMTVVLGVIVFLLSHLLGRIIEAG
ncbi:MAG: CopD family protein [Dehalococcoidia bacterium]